jgi:DNA-binding NarL/FixJ family response regulator
MPIRIVLTGYHRLLRQGLRALLRHTQDLEIVGEACNDEEMVACVRRQRPDIVLLDSEMIGTNGLIATRLIRELWPTVAVLALTSRGDEELMYIGMKAGVWGHIPKGTARRELIDMIRGASRGEMAIAPFLAHLALQEANVLSQAAGAFAKPLLNEVEIMILQAVDQGSPLDEIGTWLGLSPQTLMARLRDVFFTKLPLSPDFQAAVGTLHRKIFPHSVVFNSQ